jgi:hypothetical protein
VKIFFSPRRPDRLWGPLNLPRGKSGRGMKLTTHLQLVPRSRKCGCIHPLPHASSGVRGKKGKVFPVLNGFRMYRSLFFLISARAAGEWSDSLPGRFTPGGRAPDTHFRGGWVDPEPVSTIWRKRKFLTLPGLELRTLSHPARSKSLYRLR